MDQYFEIAIYAYGARSFGFDFYHWPIKFFSFPIPGKVQYYFDKWLEPFIRKLYGYDLLHITENFAYIKDKENAVVTIHDMLEFHQGDKYKNERFIQCAKNAKGFVTCSEYSKGQIIKDLGISSDKIEVIYWGINHKIFFPREKISIQLTLSKFGISNKYFFSCSGSDTTNRKNNDIVMSAFRNILRDYPETTLVITWSACPSYLEETFHDEIKQGKIKIIKGVTDEELATLYSGALATYFVSSSEGFGFPILESFACGTPCVTCANSSLKEIGSIHAIFVKERNIEETTETMYHFLTKGKGDTNALINYASKFNWKNTAIKYIEFYKKNL